MALFRCEACGGALEIQEGSRIAFCPYCGMKQTLPEEAAKTLDAQEKIANTLKRGFMLLEEGQFKKARKAFDRVLDSEPKNSRAYFGKLMAAVEAHHDFELADRIKEGFDDLNAWKDSDEVNAMLVRALKFAPEDMREVFSEDFRHAEFHMKGGRYQEALGEFWRLSRYHPDAMQKAEECAQKLGTTVEAALKQEFDEWDAASTSMHETAASWRDFAFSAEQLVVYLDSSYIDYVKASEREKREFLEDVYKMLDKACTYFEHNDKYNPSGSKNAHHREGLRSALEKHKHLQKTLPESWKTSQDSGTAYVIRNTKSMPKWLMWILIAIFGGFFVVVLLELLSSLNAQ